VKNLFNQIFKRKSKEDIALESEAKRQEIRLRGEAAKRLLMNPDYQLLEKVHKEDKERLLLTLLDEDITEMKTDDMRVRLIARINEIDSLLNKPRSLIWQMENLTEVRTALKEAHERQALGNKTGG